VKDSAMDVYCQFLRTDQEQKQGCASGVNFYSVGSGHELCLVCPLRELGDHAVCEHMEINLHRLADNEEGTLVVKAFCDLDDEAPEASRCRGCPGPYWHEILTTSTATILTMHHRPRASQTSTAGKDL